MRLNSLSLHLKFYAAEILYILTRTHTHTHIVFSCGHTDMLSTHAFECIDVCNLNCISLKDCELFYYRMPLGKSSGILLLAEVMTHIESKPLNSATIHSLVGFFKDRLVSMNISFTTSLF